MNDKFPNSYETFIEYLNNASEEELKKLHDELQEGRSEDNLLYKDGINPQKLSEPYETALEYLSNASEEELKKLRDTLQDNPNRDVIYDYLKDIHKVSADEDTYNEEGRKR